MSATTSQLSCNLLLIQIARGADKIPHSNDYSFPFVVWHNRQESQISSNLQTPPKEPIDRNKPFPIICKAMAERYMEKDPSLLNLFLRVRGVPIQDPCMQRERNVAGAAVAGLIGVVDKS